MSPPSCRALMLAVELVDRGADLVVVGGTARLLQGRPTRPRDLDVVVDVPSIPALVRALAELRVSVRAATIVRVGTMRINTGWGPLDVFVGARPASTPVLIDGVTLAVSA